MQSSGTEKLRSIVFEHNESKSDEPCVSHLGSKKNTPSDPNKLLHDAGHPGLFGKLWNASWEWPSLEPQALGKGQRWGEQFNCGLISMWHLGGWDVLLSSVVVFGSQKDDLSTKRVSGYQLNPLNPLSGPTHFGDCDSWAWGAGTCSMPYYMICHQILSLNIMWFHVLDILYFCSFSDGNTTRTWCESDTTKMVGKKQILRWFCLIPEVRPVPQVGANMTCWVPVSLAPTFLNVTTGTLCDMNCFCIKF